MSTQSFRGNSSGIHYTVKVSRRARHTRLKMSPEEGLTVVVPAGYDLQRVPFVVESKMAWILKVQSTFAKQRPAHAGQTETALPEVIELCGIGETWRVGYREEHRQSIKIAELSAGKLELSGAVSDHALCLAALEQWLKRRAKLRFESQLMRLASINGFKVSGISVRKQRSRWGSCSTRGNINLNLKLVFLPPLLVRYIMIHELCHTVHMNHSARYWETVALHDPDYVAHDREMRHAWRFVPAWFSGTR